MEDPWFQHVVAFLCSPEGERALLRVGLTEAQTVAIAATMVEHPGIHSTEIVRLTEVVWGRVQRAMELFDVVTDSWAPHEPRERDMSGRIVRAGDVAVPNETGYKSGAPREGRVWLRTVPSTVLQGLRTPRSHAQWLAMFEGLLSTPTGDACRRLAQVSVRMAMKVAAADVATSDYDTCRNAARSHESLADLVGVSKSSVRRVRALMAALGATALLTAGGWLTGDEREAAEADTGRRQVKVANNRAFVIPAYLQSVQIEHLPSSPKGMRVKSSKKSLVNRASRAKAAPRPGSRRNEGQRFPRNRPVPQMGQDRLQLQKLAGQLAEFFGVPASRFIGDDRGVHIGRLVNALDASGIDPARWNASSVRAAVDRWVRVTGRELLPWGARKNPFAYITTVLRGACSDVELTSFERQRQEQERARQRAAEAAAVERAVRERAASLTLEDMRRIMAEYAPTARSGAAIR